MQDVNMVFAAKETKEECVLEEVIDGISGDLEWKIDKEGCLHITGNGDYELVEGKWKHAKKRPKWCKYAKYIKSAEIDVTGITSTRRMFTGLKKLEKIDLSGLDSSNVTDMRRMFGGCEKLKNIDVSNFDTSNVTDMSGMFDNCGKLEKIDLSSFDTSNVIYMEETFGECKGLKELDLSNFDLKKLEYEEGYYYDDEYSFEYNNDLIESVELTKIKTPINLKIDIYLPEGTWVDEEGNTYDKLPLGLTESITLTKK